MGEIGNWGFCEYEAAAFLMPECGAENQTAPTESEIEGIQSSFEDMGRSGTQLRFIQHRVPYSPISSNLTPTSSENLFSERREGTITDVCEDNTGFLIGFDTFYNLKPASLRRIGNIISGEVELSPAQPTDSERQIERYQEGHKKELSLTTPQLECAPFNEFRYARNSVEPVFPSDSD